MSQNNAKKLNPILDKEVIIRGLNKTKETVQGFESLRLHN